MVSGKGIQLSIYGMQRIWASVVSLQFQYVQMLSITCPVACVEVEVLTPLPAFMRLLTFG